MSNDVNMSGWTALGEMRGNPEEVLSKKRAEAAAEKREKEEQDKKNKKDKK